MELNLIINNFLPKTKINKVSPIGNGLIHQTFLVETSQKSYVLQHINDLVFENPEILVRNHLKINEGLSKVNYKFELSNPIKTGDNQLIFVTDDQHWRLTEYIDNSITYQKVASPEMAFEASKALSYFHYCINSDQNISLEESIPEFTNFEKRYGDFEKANQHLIDKRAENCVNELLFISKYKHLCNLWIELRNKNMPNRIIHADPKISNILFNSEQKPIAIIDLDTVLSGPILYDFGDMARSFTNRLEEDDISTTDNFDIEIYKAIKEGFLHHSASLLSPLEIEHFNFAAKIVVHIQAMRFLVDYLRGDIYYGSSYEGQNLVRAKNQINLLKGMMKHDL